MMFQTDEPSKTKQECRHTCEFADMRSTLTILPLFCWLLLLVNTMEGRKDPSEYWRSVTKGQTMPEAIEGLVDTDTKPTQPNLESVKVVQDFNHKCKQTMAAHNHGKPWVHDLERNKVMKHNSRQSFEPRPNVSSYGKKEVKSKENQFFQPRPNVSAYGDDEVKSKEKQAFADDFEPRPNASAYGDDEVKSKEKQAFADDFEPRPNASAYGDDEVKSKETSRNTDIYHKQFELLRPSVSVHEE